MRAGWRLLWVALLGTASLPAIASSAPPTTPAATQAARPASPTVDGVAEAKAEVERAEQALLQARRKALLIPDGRNYKARSDAEAALKAAKEKLAAAEAEAKAEGR